MLAGLALIAAALVLDPLQGRPLGLGIIQLGMLAAGVLLVASSAVARRPRARRVLVRAGVVAASTYGTLLALELAAGLVGPPHATKNPLVALHGMMVGDAAVGFHLAPAWHGRYDDGVVATDYVVNARGDRDDDAPRPGASHRVLLLGDSFAFGQALPRAHTIEASLEAASADIDAYNLGVPGYSAIHALRRLEQSDWWRGDDVVYLFFNNDVHPGSAALDYVRVIDGHPVPRLRPDGTPYDDAELRARLELALSPANEGLRGWLGDRLALQRLRAVVANARDAELRRTGLPAAAFDPHVVDQAVGHAVAMKARAAERGARFHVIVIPTAAEVAERSWSHATASFVAAADAAGLSCDVQLLERLSTADYLAHDGHFAQSGAQATAALLLERVGRNAS